MNLEVIKNIILNTILIIFPLLVYLVLICYNDHKNNAYQKLLLNCALFTSLYLCLEFGTDTQDNKIILFCNIPIVIAYMKKIPKTGLTLSLINIIYCYFYLPNIYIIVTIKYLSYFILYICANKKRLSTGGYILSVAVLQGFFLSFEYFFRETSATLNDFFELLLVVFLYYFVTFMVVYIFKTIEKIQSLNSTIKILEKDKKVKDALFKLTHEIKNPLAVCKGYLDMIDIDNKDKTIKYISIMKQEINRSLNIMCDFLELNKIKILKEEIDLNILLEDVYDCFKILSKAQNVELIYQDREDEDIYFTGDYERLKQVIINILKNSLEAVESKGKIKIYTNIYKKYIDIVIEDNGIGMDEETLSKVKEMFYSTKKGGSGIGIALSDEIIKAHNGELIYYSELNKGTRVTIRLPK